MLVPEILCGDTKAVASACKKHIVRFRSGGSWIDAGPLVDVSSAAGLIMLGGPSPLVGGKNIRLYAPFWEFEKVFSDNGEMVSVGARAFDEALSHVWSMLGLVSQACYSWLKNDERAARFLQSVIDRWAEIASVGCRYTFGLPNGDAFWNLPHLLKYVLARRGVPQSQLVQPLPSGGIADLLRLSGSN